MIVFEIFKNEFKALQDVHMFKPSNVRQLRIPGDLIIGGVFPVHAKGNSGGSPCGEIFETRLE